MSSRTLLLIAVSLALVIGPSARSQEPYDFKPVELVKLDDLHPGPRGERVVDLYLRVLSKHGDPVKLQEVDLEIREDERRIDPADISATPLGETNSGVTCVLLIDVSPTMRGAPFDDAKAAALNFVGRLGEFDELAVFALSGKPKLVAPFGLSRSEARIRLDDLEVDQDPAPTVLYDAVYDAVQLIRKEEGLPRRSFIVVLSDGKDGGSVHSLNQVIEFSRGDETQARILTFAIGYARFGGTGLASLQTLASETGGDYFEALSSRKLKTFYEGIWNQVDRSYVVTYPSRMDGQTHSVTVSIDGVEDSRSKMYPDWPRPIWHFAVPAGLLLLLLLTGVLVLRRRSAGQLSIIAGAKSGESFRIQRGTTRIGALPDNDIVVNAPKVSRNHAEIHAAGRRVEIRDLHSTNGTFVNETRIQTSPLNPGDRIRIGDVDLLYER